MVYSAAKLDSVFGALADPTRRAILSRLAMGDRSISELASRFDMSLPAVSKHIRVLEHAGLAHVQREGRVRRTRLKAAPMREALEWIEPYRQFWEFQLDQLAAYLEQTSPPESPEWPQETPVAEERAPALEVRRTIRASQQRVFDAWTTPEEVNRWCAPGPMTVAHAEIDLRVGGAYRIEMRSPEGAVHRAFGVYREIHAPRRLVYTWSWEDKLDVKDTIVTVEFNALGDSTEVVLRHGGLPSADSRKGHGEGWNACLDKFAIHTEGSHSLRYRAVTAPTTQATPSAYCASQSEATVPRRLPEETETTRRVIQALPAEASEFRPHPRSLCAREVAAIFAKGQGTYRLGASQRVAVATDVSTRTGDVREVLGAFETTRQAVIDALEAAPDARLTETIPFFTGPKQVGEIRVMEWLWFALLDQIHHRGQLSVYVRMAEGKVPSIYGPSADEPWM